MSISQNLSFKKTDSKAYIACECDRWECDNKDWQEGNPMGIGEMIRYKSDVVYSCYEEAADAIDKFTSRDRWTPVAVLYRNARKHFNEECYSAKLRKLAEQRDAERSKWEELRDKPHFTGVKSKTVKCKHCESSISTKYLGNGAQTCNGNSVLAAIHDGRCGIEYLHESRESIRTNYCPVCGEDLRPKTIIDRIESYKSKWKEKDKAFRDLYETEYAKHNARNAKNAEVCWLVHVETH